MDDFTNERIEITMIAYNSLNDETVKITKQLPWDASWGKQAAVFHKFLAAQSYVLEPEQVGVNWDDF